MTRTRIIRNPEKQALFVGTGVLASSLLAANGGEAALAVEAVTSDTERTLAVDRVDVELQPEQSIWVEASFESQKSKEPGALTGFTIVVTRHAESYPVQFLLEGNERVEAEPAVDSGADAAAEVEVDLKPLTELVKVAADARRSPFVWSIPVAPGGPWLVGRVAVANATQSTIEVVSVDDSVIGTPMPASASVAATADVGGTTQGAVTTAVSRAEAEKGTPASEAAAAVGYGAAPGWDVHRASLDALALESTRRRAVAYLARGGDAAVTLDLAVAGPEEIVEALAASILAGTNSDEAPDSPGALSCWIECRTLVTLSRCEELPVSVEAALLRELGAIARYPSTLGELTGGVQSLEVLRANVQRENLFLLQDRRLSIRQRAWEWLEARGVEVPDYLPTDAASKRRRAIATYLHALDMKNAKTEDSQRD